MITIGIDVGYGYTKDSNYNIFKSAYQTHNTSLSNDKNRLNVDGITYYIGNGIDVMDHNKIESVLNKLCIFYSISLNGKNTINDYILSVAYLFH